MNIHYKIVSLTLICFLLSSCVSSKKYKTLELELADVNKQLDGQKRDYDQQGEELNDYIDRLSKCEDENEKLTGELNIANSTIQLRQEQMQDLKDQLEDVKAQRDKQLTQVGDLTALSQSANENIKETLSQLEQKEKYIQLLQAAKSKADSINLALAVNLKGVLSEGIEDEDIEIEVDKTVVFINLSHKMLYQSGSAKITTRANEVLGKIARIIESRPDVEVMVEGYTDNVPIKNSCLEDNWDLSVLRATSVVRALQFDHNIDPNRLVAAGRGEHNILASNDTAEGRAINRRTRIIILPKLDQFYDLLNPDSLSD